MHREPNHPGDQEKWLFLQLILILLDWWLGGGGHC